jgi:hypothetical protein
MAAKYSTRKNFKFVHPGVQILYNNANSSFYEVYDSNLQGSLCEEIIFYSKPLDLQIAVVNGIMMDEPDNPNPRIDKLYPFIGFGYEPFDEGRSIYHKSLIFKMQPDSDIITALYQMIIDGTYLSVMPPMLVAGEQSIGSDVIVPGLVTTTTDPNSAIVPIRAAQDIATGLTLLKTVEESIADTSLQEIDYSHKQTAYAMSSQQTQQQILIGPFIEMIKSYVKQYGRLVIGDIKQYLTIPDVDKIIDNGELVYKTFINHGKGKTKKINFNSELPDTELTDEEQLQHSFDILEKQGGHKSDISLYDVNPTMFNDLKFECTIEADMLNPMSDDLERMMGLEIFDKSIAAVQAGVAVNLDEVYKDFVLQNFPKSNMDVDKYMKDASSASPLAGLPTPNANPGAPTLTPTSNMPASMNPAQAPLTQKITNPPLINNNR